MSKHKQRKKRKPTVKYHYVLEFFVKRGTWKKCTDRQHRRQAFTTKIRHRLRRQVRTQVKVERWG